MNASGKAIKYGNNIDTDVIIPARYLNTSDVSELASHCMEDLDHDFVNRVRPGDIIVAGTNFGCGSSREHAPIVIKASGISCIIAADFARIFYRNAINIGLPIIECREAAEAVGDGDILEVDFAAGNITNVTKNTVYKINPFPPFLQNIILSGGLLSAVDKGALGGDNYRKAGQ